MLAVPLLSACAALLVPTPTTARAIEELRVTQPLTSPLTRRSVLALPLLLGAFPAPPAAAAELATAYFSAGDPRFLQPVFDEVKYMGVKKCEAGTLGDLPAVRVSYDPAKVSYKYVLGTFWRSCDPTSAEQFGEGPSSATVIWVTEEQAADAKESLRRLQKSTEYRSPTFGPMFKGRPILTEVRPLAAEFVPATGDEQDYYLNEPKAFEKLSKKTGRTKWFADAFKPVTVTACEKEQGQGTVCGFVYFPCNEENGCSAVTKGAF